MTNRCAVFVVVCLAGLGGCGTESRTPDASPKKQAAPRYNLTGYPPAFKEGYTDACATPRKRNEQRFKEDTDYKIGWQDGSSFCKR